MFVYPVLWHIEHLGKDVIDCVFQYEYEADNYAYRMNVQADNGDRYSVICTKVYYEAEEVLDNMNRYYND